MAPPLMNLGGIWTGKGRVDGGEGRVNSGAFIV